MSASLRVFIATALFIAAGIGQAGAANMLALTSVARAYGFLYVIESTQAAVQLSRPGLSVLIRAGDPRYQVNDEVRYLNRAPVFRNSQIFVDAALEPVLADLAATHPWPVPALVAAPARLPDAASTPLTIGAKYVPGSLNIEIAGSGPAGLPVEVVLKARISRDLPTATIGRSTVTVGSDGRYGAVISAASIELTDTIYIATASAPHVAPVSTQVLIQVPNPTLHSPNDKLPPKS